MYTQIQKAKQKYSKREFINFNNKAILATKELKQKEAELIKALQIVFF